MTIVNVGAIEIVNNSLSEGTKEFNISIGGIKAVGVPGVPTNVLGNPVKIIVYDNDCKYSTVSIIMHASIVNTKLMISLY